VRRAALLLGAAAAVTGCGSGAEGPAPSDRWALLRPATLQRTEIAAARVGRHVYVVGGFERVSGRTTGALERYDIRRNRWRRLRPLPVGVNHPVAVAYRGNFYVHGGYRARHDLSSASARLWRYSPSRNRWSRLPRSAVPRAAHAAAVLGGRLYVAGGRSDAGELRSLDIYDFKRRRWSQGPNLSGPARDHTTGVAAGGFFYVLAGRDLSGPGNYRVADRYDPRRHSWHRLPPMRKARGGIASAPVSRGRIVVFGGEEPGGAIGEVELWSPRRRSWRSLPPMRTPRHGLGGVSLGNRVYAIEGGPQPGFHFSSAIEALDVP
jgi:N-acetylneuraminic acid mutarotase